MTGRQAGATCAKDAFKKKALREGTCGDSRMSGLQSCKRSHDLEGADTAADSIWRVTVIDSGGVEIEKANHAARNAQRELRQRYDLVTDS
jgi:hypothetical protein